MFVHSNLGRGAALRALCHPEVGAADHCGSVNAWWAAATSEARLRWRPAGISRATHPVRIRLTAAVNATGRKMCGWRNWTSPRPVTGWPKSCRLSRREGDRSRSERSRWVSKFIEFMARLSQCAPQSVEAVAVTAGRGVGGNSLQFADGGKRKRVPQLEHDHLALRHRESSQRVCQCLLARLPRLRRLEPPAGLQLAGNPAPPVSAIVERAVPKTPDQVMLRLGWPLAQAQQGYERVVQYILRFAVTQAQRPPVKHQLRGFLVVKPLRPIALLVAVHPFEMIDTAAPRFVCGGGGGLGAPRRVRHPRGPDRSMFAPEFGPHPASRAWTRPETPVTLWPCIRLTFNKSAKSWPSAGPTARRASFPWPLCVMPALAPGARASGMCSASFIKVRIAR